MSNGTNPQVDSDVLTELDQRGITEARHFTMSNNLLGILSSGRLLSRADVKNEKIVELVALDNCYTRWDNQWFGHVNLSVQRINGYLYGISSGKWHVGDEDLWWAVLGFDREILAHDGVVFSTTNNGYASTRRAAGLPGLEAIFGDRIATKGGQTVVRNAHAPNQPTDPQAEALYPKAVDVQYLKTIYVPRPELADSVHGWLDLTGHEDVLVRFDPEAFA